MHSRAFPPRRKELPFGWFPMALTYVAFIAGAIIIFSQPAMRQKIHEKIGHPMQQSMQRNVDNGTMTQERADKMAALMEKVVVPCILFGIIVGFPLAWLFMGWIYWLFVKYILGGAVFFRDVFAVYALGSGIGLIGAALTGVIVLITGSFSGSWIDLGFLAPAADSRVLHAILARFAPFTLWHLWVLSFGFAAVGKLPVKKTMYGMAGLWLAWSVITVLFTYALSQVPRALG